jgi:AlkA N-terminal domain
LKAQDHDSVAPRSRNLFRWRQVLQCLRSGYFEVSFDTGRDAVNVRVQFGDPCSLFFIIERVRAIFDLDAGWATIARNAGN